MPKKLSQKEKFLALQMQVNCLLNLVLAWILLVLPYDDQGQSLISPGGSMGQPLVPLLLLHLVFILILCRQALINWRRPYLCLSSSFFLVYYFYFSLIMRAETTGFAYSGLEKAGYFITISLFLFNYISMIFTVSEAKWIQSYLAAYRDDASR